MLLDDKDEFQKPSPIIEFPLSYLDDRDDWDFEFDDGPDNFSVDEHTKKCPECQRHNLRDTGVLLPPVMG